jgi:predicted transposase YbfD/YdcC
MDQTTHLFSSFKDITDPRTEKHSSRHILSDILILTILAVICGADNWVSVEQFGHLKKEWLKDFLKLPHGIPSHDTIGNLFSRLNPKELQDCFIRWINELFDFSGGEIIAIDGKTLRRSYDTATNRPAIHMVSAWACKNRLVLGQVKTETKSNEVTAIPELLKKLDLVGSIVTIDAMGCQKKIAQQIIKQGGDYVFNLKGNQMTLHKDIALFLESYVDKNQCSKSVIHTTETVDGDHGRIETRKYWITEDIKWLEQYDKWPGLKSAGMVEYESIVKTTGERIVERRFFINSIEANPKKFSEATRLHWGIENGLHWCLDVGFDEDRCRVRKDNAPENFAIIRHIALNLLKQEKTVKTGIKNKRLMAGWDNTFLVNILGGNTTV